MPVWSPLTKAHLADFLQHKCIRIDAGVLAKGASIFEICPCFTHIAEVAAVPRDMIIN
jgi:hypothetical protein